jgi:hypothetical protein
MTAFVKDLQRLLQAHGEPLPKFGADGVWGEEGRAALDRLLTAKPLDAASLIHDDYWPMLYKIESGDRPYLKARTSSASGLYQFIKSTWQAEGGKWGPDPAAAFGGLFPTVEEQRERAQSFTTKNAAMLKAAGLPVNKASLYAAHFLGVAGAIRIIQASVGTPIDQVTAANQRTANPSILGGGKRVADFLTWLHTKTGEWAR